MRVASLLRLSDKKQAARGGDLDIAGQRQEIASFLETKPGWTMVREYTEKGVSAYKNSRADRDELVDVMNAAKAGEFDALVVWKLDRLSRRMVDTPAIVTDLNDLGIEVWSVVDAPGGMKVSAETAMETLMLVLHGFKNEKESEDISLRVRTRARQLASEGKWMGSKVPFGYQLIARKDGQGEPVMQGGRPVRDLVPHPVWAPVVRQIFERYLAGQGYFRITVWLNEAGVRTYSGSTWSQKTVKNIIENPIYCGRIVSFRTEAVARSNQRRTGANPIWAKGKHEGLVCDEAWETAQRLKAARTSIPMRQRSSEFTLVGVIRCAVCGGPMGGTMRRFRRNNGEQVAYPVYLCINHKQSKSCPVTSYVAAEIEEAFITALEVCFTAPTALRTFMEQLARATSESAKADQVARRRMQDRLKEIETALKRLDRAYLEAGTIDDAEYVQKKSTYQEERRGIEAELARPVTAEEARDVEALVELVGQLRENWFDEETTPEERKALALSIVKGWKLRVLVHPDKRVEILPA